MSNFQKIQIQIQKLEDAIASGVTRVKYADREVNYRSIDEMLRALDFLQKKVKGKKGIRLTEASYESGLK